MPGRELFQVLLLAVEVAWHVFSADAESMPCIAYGPLFPVRNRHGSKPLADIINGRLEDGAHAAPRVWAAHKLQKLIWVTKPAGNGRASPYR